MEVTGANDGVATNLDVGVVWQARDESGHTLELRRVVERAEENVVARRLARLGVCRNLGLDQGNELIVDRLVNKHASGRGAVLATVEVAGDHDLSGSGSEVGIREDDYRSLATEFEVNALEVGRSTLGNFHAGTNRTGDRNQLRNLVVDHCAAGVAVTGNHVEHAGWQELCRNLGQQQGAHRRGVTWLQNGGVTRGERRCELPGGHV